MKTALVTGAAGGIGRAISAKLAAAGYRVGMLDLDLDMVSIAAESVPHAHPLAGDISQEASAAAAVHVFGDVPDLLVNNAGIVMRGALLEEPISNFRKVLDVNLVGALIMARLVVPGMIERGEGAIVNVTSIAAVQANAGGGAYGPAKAGLCNLTQVMALEWAPFGIRVNAVAPGLIDAGMSPGGAAFPDVQRQREAMVPQGRLGSPEDVAEVVAFLGSSAAAYMSGHQIMLDGGLSTSILRKLPKPAT